MSVYKEGYHIVKKIIAGSVQIFPDAADFGFPTDNNDEISRDVKQLIEWYGIDGTRNEQRYGTGTTVTHDVLLIDEWVTKQEERFSVTYVSTRANGATKGYFYVTKL